MLRLLLALITVSLLPLSAAELRVAVLHPLLGDLARQVGGDRVDVVNLIGPNGDPHHFEPNPDDLRQARGAQLYLVAGMGLEGYLPKLRSVIDGKAELIEVGATLPALEENGACTDPEHHHGHADPHWWHSIQLFGRATGVVAEAFAARSPENAEFFRSNADAYRKQLDALEKWSRREIARVPRDRRHLATAHAAFNYFCHEFGFTPHPVQGLNREQMPDPRELAALIAALKADHVAAVFPEKESNPKILGILTRDTGIKLGEPLIADGTGGLTYEQMVRHNVTAIVKGLE